MIRRLANEEPFLTPDQLGDLDDEQMAALYFERAEYDQLKQVADPLDRPFQCDYQRMTWKHKYAAGRQLGYTDQQIESDCEAAWAVKVADPKFRRRHGIPDPK